MCSRSGGGLVKGVVLGLRIGVAFALAFGGYACYSHPTLRFVLRRSGALPLDTVRLFDYAAEQNLLRKVSRGYTFVHDLLQDNFAALEI